MTRAAPVEGAAPVPPAGETAAAMTACPICCNTAGNRRHSAREMMFGTREPFHYIECARCGCLRLEGGPADPASAYPEGYYSFAGGDAPAAGGVPGTLVKWRDRFALERRGIPGRLLHALRPAPLLASLAPIRPSARSRVLDLGCGAGLLLNRLHALGFRDLLGIDPHLEADRRPADGPALLRRSIHEVDGEWDLVMLHHSFEHVPDPCATIEAIAARLAPGGTCLIRTPVASSFAWAHYGVDWVQLDAPRHIVVHSVDSLTRLASRAGLAVERVVHDSTEFQFWGSEQVLRDIPLLDPRSHAVDPAGSIFGRGEIRRFRRRARRLNAEKLGDQAAFYLRRADGAPR